MPDFSKTTVTRVINSLYPDAHNVRHIEHGYGNHVVIVDNRYVVRFPRNKAAWEGSRLERFILSKLDFDVVPKLVHYNESPPYLVQTYLPGDNINGDQFRLLPISTQQNIGEQIAIFAHSLHSALDVDEFRHEYSKLIPDGDNNSTYHDYLKEMLTEYTFPTGEQDKIAKQYFKAWLDIRPSKPVVIHDDLHIHNLLIQNGQLSGVVDFETARVGTAEQEMRQLYRLSDTALLSAIKTYNSLAHVKLEIEAAKTWAISQELATYARELRADKKLSPAFIRAARHLRLWFPEIFA